MKKGFQIAIDGPIAAGCSSVAKKLARELKLTFIDTGAMYRVVTFLALRNKLELSDGEKIVSLLKKVEMRVEWESELEDGLMRIWVDGEEVTGMVRTKKIDVSVARVAALPRVRETLVGKQQEMARGKGVVMEGRDIGTRVLPEADLKIYLDANEKVRVERRMKELRQAGYYPSWEGLKKRIRERDRIDRNRKTDPLRSVKGALVLDTGDLTIDEVVEKIVKKAKTLQNKGEK